MSIPCSVSPLGLLTEHAYPFKLIYAGGRPNPPKTPDGRITILPGLSGGDGNGNNYWRTWWKGDYWWPYSAAPDDGLRGAAFETANAIALSRIDFDFGDRGFRGDAYVAKVDDGQPIQVGPATYIGATGTYSLRVDGIVRSKGWKFVCLKSLRAIVVPLRIHCWR